MQAMTPPASAAAPDHPGAARLGAIVWATSAAVMMLNVAPAAELHLRRDAHLSSTQIGAAFAIELAAMGLASLPARGWLGRVNAVHVARCSYALFALGNLLAIGATHDFAWYAGARALAGLGAGTLMVLGLGLVAGMRRCDRWYALISVVQIVSGALLLHGLGSMASDPLQAFFVAGALAAGVGFISAGALAQVDPRAGGTATKPAPAAARPADRPSTGSSAGSAAGLFLRGRQALALALVFNLVVGGLWSFVTGYAPGMAPARVDEILAVATVAGLAGALAAFVAAGRYPLPHLLLAGHAGLAIGAGLLHAVRTPLGFTAGCCVLSLGWNFSVPLVLAALARQDASGRLMPHANLVFALGLAIGPLSAGWLIAALGIDALFAGALAGLALGLALGWPALRELREPQELRA